QLLGTTIDLDVLNYMGLAQAQFDVVDFLEVLQGDLSLSSPQEVLTTDVTMLQIFDALATVASNNGDAAAVTALNALAAYVTMDPSTIQLGDLLTVNTINGELVDAQI